MEWGRPWEVAWIYITATQSLSVDAFHTGLGSTANRKPNDSEGKEAGELFSVEVWGLVVMGSGVQSLKNGHTVSVGPLAFSSRF